MGRHQPTTLKSLVGTCGQASLAVFCNCSTFEQGSNIISKARESGVGLWRDLILVMKKEMREYNEIEIRHVEGRLSFAYGKCILLIKDGIFAITPSVGCKARLYCLIRSSASICLLLKEDDKRDGKCKITKTSLVPFDMSVTDVNAFGKESNTSLGTNWKNHGCMTCDMGL